MSLNFSPKGLINNIPALVKVIGAKQAQFTNAYLSLGFHELSQD